MRHPALLLAAAALLCATTACRACSEMALSDPEAPASVSFRTMDFPAFGGPVGLITYTLAAVPAGAKLIYSPVDHSGCTLSEFDGQPVKYGFVCTAFVRDEVISSHIDACGDRWNTSNAVGLCMDGINEKGLSVGAPGFFQPTNATYRYPSNPDPNSSLPALSDEDLMTYLLSNFQTVEEVEEAVNQKKLQLIDTMSGDANFGSIPIHWSITDREGNFAVLENTGPDEWQVLRNPDGVNTNWPVQLSHEATVAWRDQKVDLFGEQDGKLAYPGFCEVTESTATGSSAATDPATKPGAISIGHSTCDYITRYAMLAMLRNATYMPPVFPEDDPYVPTDSDDPALPTIVQGLRIMGYVVVPGVMPNNTWSTPGDITDVTFIRDNIKAIYYLQTAASPQWVQVDVPRLVKRVAAAGGGVRYTPLEALAPVSMQWAVDRTAMAARGE